MSLSKGHQAIADLLERHPQAILGTAAEVGKQAGVNASTVVRYAVGAGFSGWTEMQHVQRALYLSGLNATDTRDTHASGDDESPFRASVRQDLANVRTVHDSIPDTAIAPVIQRLLASRRIVVAASGSYIGPAVVLAHLCTILGLPAQLEDRSGVNLGGTVAHLTEDDCLVAINLWRQTTDLVTATRLAQEKKVPVIAITDTKRGIAQHADHVLLVPSESASFFQSTVASMAVVYGLIAELSAHLGPEAEKALHRSQEVWDAMQSLGPLGAGKSSV